MPTRTTSLRPKPEPPEPYTPLTVGAEHLGIHQKTIRRWIAEGKLPGYRIGGQVRIKMSELDALVQKV